METVQVTNVDELAEKYGSDLVKELNARIDSAIECGHRNFKIETSDNGNGYFAEVIFATETYAWFYEIQLSSKRINREYIIGINHATKMLEMMRSLEA